MVVTFIILILTVTMFIIGRIRADVVALCALAALLVFDVLTPEEALSGFSSSVVIMMVGLFVVGGAIFQTGLAKVASQKIMKLAAGNDLRMFLLVMLTTSAIGAFVSNTGTVALMMPIIVSMAAQNGSHPGRLLMPLAFASSLGGMLTLIGTPPNLVIQETLTGAGYQPLSFFSFFPVGIIVITIGILVLLPLSRLFLGKTRQKDKRTKRLWNSWWKNIACNISSDGIASGLNRPLPGRPSPSSTCVTATASLSWRSGERLPVAVGSFGM